MSNIQVEIVQCHIVRELVVYVEKLGQRLISEGRNEMKSDHRFSDILPLCGVLLLGVQGTFARNSERQKFLYM